MTTKWAAIAEEWKKGWLLVLAAAIAQGVAITHFYTLGIYMKPLGELYGWSRADIGFVQIIYSIVMVLFGSFVAYFADRFGPRRLAFWGMIANCLTLALYAAATEDIWTWYLVAALNAAAGLFCNAPVLTAAISRNFKAGLGMALALTLAGGAVYTATFLPIFTAHMIETYGVRVAYLANAGLGAALSIPTLYFFFERESGKSPKNEDHAVVHGKLASKGKHLAGYTWVQAFKQWRYWRLALGTLFIATSVPAIVIHFVPIVTDQKISIETAAVAAGLIGIASILGRMGTGVLLDMFPARVVGACCCLAPIAAFVLISNGGGLPTIIAAALIIGLAVGAEIDVVSYLTNRYFGVKNYAVIYSVLYSVFSVGAASGIYLAGRIHDKTGSYDQALTLFGVLVMLAALLLLSLGKYPVFDTSASEKNAVDEGEAAAVQAAG